MLTWSEKLYIEKHTLNLPNGIKINIWKSEFGNFYLDLLVGLMNVLPELILRIGAQFFSQYDIICKVFRTSMVRIYICVFDL